MKFLNVDTYYSDFLHSFYAAHPDMGSRRYAEQRRILMDQCFGIADFYSSNLVKLGHETTEVVANCEQLQRQWAKENGIKLAQTKHRWAVRMRAGFIPWPKRIQSSEWFYTVLTAQVKHYRPDVLYIQDINGTSPVFLREVRPYVQLIAGQIACPIAQDTNFSEYDLVLSSLPHYVQRFKEHGLKSECFRLGFEYTLSNKLITLTNSYPVVHIGGYGTVHQERNKLLEGLIKGGVPLSCWGYGVNHLPVTSPIRKRYKGEAWGLDMYNIRHNSKIGVSKHISSVADVYANIMSIYEITGVGSLLVIDKRNDLSDLFEPGKEVVAYTSAEECVELINYYLEHEEERKAIARAGQERTLAEHTYYERMKELVDIVHKYM